MCGPCFGQCALVEKASTVWEPRRGFADCQDDDDGDDNGDDNHDDDDDESKTNTDGLY